jgi:hypothetical protein
MTKRPKIGSIELRSRDGKPFATFNTFKQAVKACVESGVTFADMFEYVKSGYIPSQAFERVCTFEVAE